jgi:hypothetical protein
MKIHRLVVAGLLTAGIGIATVPATEAGASPTTLIVGAAHGCNGTYSTIGAAVAAASPGDTIKVCAGTYDETVNVNIPDLTFDGARAGKPGRATWGRTVTKESVLSSVNGDFILGSASDNTVIDGFTLTGAGSPTVNHDGIEAFGGSSGLDATDNVIVGDGNGINFQNPNGAEPATISENYIFNNNSEGNPGSNGQTGTGVFISNGPANNTTISNNTFGEDSQTAINFAGQTGNPSVGLVVSNNKSLNDATFVVATNSTGAVIESNKITVNGAVPGGSGTGILDFGANSGLDITLNKMTSNATASSAISLQTYAGSASTDTTVTYNRVSGWDNGIKVASTYTNAVISNNFLTSNAAFGIYVSSGTSSNTVGQNKVTSDAGAAVDCTDLSTGSGSEGTANTWSGDKGLDRNSSPAGIC